IAQDHDRLLPVANQADLGQQRGRNRRPVVDDVDKTIQADFLIFNAELIVKAALEGQSADERKLTAFEVRALRLAAARPLPFDTPPGVTALSGSLTAPDAFALLLRPLIGA